MRARAALALGSSLLLGCATAAGRTEASHALGAAHAVREPSVEPLALSAAGPAASETAAPSAPAPSKPAPSELRAFTREEAVRIASVQRYVKAAARKQGVDPTLINGIIWVESKFVPRARGHLGPRGLMQLMPRTGRDIARKLHRRYRPYSADFNIHAGTYYFASMRKAFHGDVTLALAAYNAGPTVVRAFLDDNQPLPEQLQNYAQSVLTASRAFAERGP